MDLGGTTTATTTPTGPESTVLVEKPSGTSEVAETPSASSDKNGSVPDSSADSVKDSACGSATPTKSKDVTKESASPLQKAPDAKASASSSKVDDVKSPSKPAVTTSTAGGEAKQDKDEIKPTGTGGTGEKGSSGRPTSPENVIADDDDLVKRMEAIERGEDLNSITEGPNKTDESSHQNGTLEKTPEKRTEATQSKPGADSNPGSSADAAKPVAESTETVAKQSSPKTDGKIPPVSDLAEAVSSNAKRKHPLSETEANEPVVKKVHVADETDGQKMNDGKPAPPASAADPPVEKLEKPPSVENMEVDGSPEPETSSPKDTEMLADTEPNTESDMADEKSEEISSSVAEEPVRQGSDSTEAGKTDNSNVSSSDDKREGTAGKPKPPESEVSASVLPTPSQEEAMDVDEDEADLAESSTSGGTAGSVAIPVVEPPCIRKVAYLCTDKDEKDGQSDDKSAVASTVKPSATSTSAAASSTRETSDETTASTSNASDKMEVDSAPKASSSAKRVTQREDVDVVDSSNVVVKEDAGAIEKPSASCSVSKPTAGTAEESVVESSQPSSSSDLKKQSSSDSRMTEQLHEAVHRYGLLAKANRTPNSSTAALTPSSSNPSTPKTLNPVTTTAVSSTNVYSSTPIHPNFVKTVSSGNVSKITNPPSSAETSRIEADETTTTAVPATNSKEDQSSTSLVTETVTEEKKPSTVVKKSSPAKTETSSTGSVTAGSSDSSAKSTASKKELRHESSNSSSSSSSLKTTDVSEVDSCTAASGMNTTDEINLYMSNARKLNGISSTSDGSELDIKHEARKSHAFVKQDEKVSLGSVSLDLSGALSSSTPAEQQYEVSVWYEGKDLQFLSVERIHSDVKVEMTADGSNIDSSSKQSLSTTTNGSVSSIGPFTLPGNPAGSSAGQSSDSSSSVATVTGTKSGHSLTVPQMKQTVIGPKALCDLLIDEFQKLRRTFAPDDATEDEVDQHLLKSPKTPSNPRGQRKESAKKSASRGQKRAKAVESDEDEELATPRVAGSSASKQAAKRAKGSPIDTLAVPSAATPKSKSTPEPKQFDICCLARWTDRKYYAGRVTNYRPDNKYVVVFEDGCSKTLSRDIIVFGEDGVLPILHHSIHALTGGDTYEPAIVEEIKRNEANEVVYGVRTASSTLEVTATDIYLSDEQAKWIHNACKDKPDPIQLHSGTVASHSGEAADKSTVGGPAFEGTPGGVSASDPTAESGDKSARSTRSKRAGTADRSATPGTPEAGYSGGVGKKGRRGRRKLAPPPESNISECSDASDGYEDATPYPTSPESTGLDAVDGVQPELQRTEQESELARMQLVSVYFGTDVNDSLDELLGPIPVNGKHLFRNKHFLLTCTIPPKATTATSKCEQFSSVPFVKQHLRRQIEAGGGKVYQFFEDVPKNKYKQCKLIAPRPSTTAMYVQCLASDITAVSHEWIIQCCQVLTLVDFKPFVLPAGWSFLEKRYIEWGCGRAKDKRTSATPFASVSINVASLCKDFTDFWSRVCKFAGATVRLIKTDADVTENLTGYLLTDQEFPENIKIQAARNGLLVVSTVWVVQCLILGRVCHPNSNEKLTQIYQEDDY